MAYLYYMDDASCQPWIAIMTRSILFLVVLVLSVPEVAEGVERTPTDAEIEAALCHMEGARWYGIYMLGTKMGWVREEVILTDNEVTAHWQTSYKMLVDAKETCTMITSSAVYLRGGDWALLRVEGTLEDQDRTVAVEGTRRCEAFHLEAVSRGHVAKVVWPWPAADVTELVPWASADRMRVGDSVSYHAVDIAEQKRYEQSLTFTGERGMIRKGRQVRVRDFLLRDERGICRDFRLSENGIVLEGGLGPSVRMVLEDEASAKRIVDGGLDLSKSSLLPADRPLDEKLLHLLTRLEMRLVGARGTEILTDARQRILAEDDGGVVLEIRARSLHDLKGYGPAWASRVETSVMPILGRRTKKSLVLPDPLWVKCTTGTGCDHPKIRELAKREAGDRRGMELVCHFTKLVHYRLDYQRGVSLVRAEEILTDGRGDCMEYSVLLVALLRARGYPSRVVSGLAYAGSDPPAFGFHAWVEVWVDGHWIAVDPTWDEYPVDATHIAFDFDGGYKLYGVFGQLQLEIKAVEYAPSAP